MDKPTPRTTEVYDWYELEKWLTKEKDFDETELDDFRCELHDMFAGGNGVHAYICGEDSDEEWAEFYNTYSAKILDAMDINVNDSIEVEISW